MRQYHEDATTAVQQGNHVSNCMNRAHAVAYAKGLGWYVYDPSEGCPEGDPEFLCIGTGYPPFPLNNDAVDVWLSIVRNAVERR